MARRTARLLVAAAAAALALSGVAAAAAAPASAAPSRFTHDPVRDREALYDLLDTARARQGLTPLRRLPALEDVAQGWSAQMASTGALVHDPVLGARIPAGWWSCGENIGGARGVSPAALERAWLASPPHRANQLDAVYDAVGIGVGYGHDGTVYVTTDFAALPLP